jgi:hypothetical protein
MTFRIMTFGSLGIIEQHALKNISSCYNIKITFYLDTSGAYTIKHFTAVIYRFP